MINSGLSLLLSCTLSILAVLALRVPLRRLCGAGCAYQAWLLAPLAMLMALMPDWTPAQQPALAALPVIRIVKTAGATAAAASGQGGWGVWILLAWAAGALAACLLFARAQRRLVLSLGPLAPRGALFVAAHSLHGPLLLGLFNPRIVMPADFEQRYSPAQQTLVIAHERMHRRRGDHVVNLVLAFLQCLFWFHPLVHIGAARCRFDQELACDALVLAAFPGEGGAYARALLQTQALHADAASYTPFCGTPPASCHWQSSHPLKERIMSLQQLSHPSSRRLAGRLLLAACAGLTAYGALAAGAKAVPAPAATPIYELTVKMEADGATSTVRMRAAAPGKFEVRSDPQGKAWSAALVVTPAAAGHVMIASTVTRQGRIVGKPGLLTRLGDTGKVRADGDNKAENSALDLTVTEVATLVPGA